MDPLERKSDEKNPNFLRGFFDAEKRKPIKTPDRSFASYVVGGCLSALPVAFIIYFGLRASMRAQQATNDMMSGKSSRFTEAMKRFRGMTDPLGTKSFEVSVKDTKFRDVIGVPEALLEVQQYVEFLKMPEKFTRLGGRLPKGCLLTGKPGTGKTLLARAVAGEADVPFFSCSGADFIEVYVGSGPKRVRELFESAKAKAPSVIFLDEVDAIGSRSNGQGAGGVSSEENRTVNQLLAELDGLQQNEAVVVFAATNFPENLDKALLREGRFDRKVEIPMPDEDARRDLFMHYLKKIVTGDPSGPKDTSHQASNASTEATSVSSSVTAVVPAKDNLFIANRLASLTPGISPATIAAIVNEAALAAAISGEPVVSIKTLMPAIDDVLIGKKHRSRMSVTSSKRVALHEAGHTLVAWLLPQQSKVIKVSITPRANAGGFTQQLGRETLDHMTDHTMFTDLCVLLGGRIAEMALYDNLSTGAQDDYQRATKLAMNQFLAFGMSDSVGLLSFDYQRLDQGRMYQLCSESTQHMAEVEAAKLVSAAFKFSTQLLQAHRATLLKVADALFEKKELLEEDLIALIGPRSETPMHAKLEGDALAALNSFVQRSADIKSARIANDEDENDIVRQSPTRLA
jgi:AFG3 family protein